jgi:LysR family glycine cleavage system transcriptional activator
MSTVGLQGVKTFCRVAETLSFKTVANELCVTASAVSHRVKDLEGRLGVKLFERRPRFVALTDAGQLFYDEVSPLIRGIDESAERIRQRYDRYTLRVHAPAFFASELVVPRLSEFALQHPNVDIRIEGKPRSEIAHSKDVDLSIVLTSQSPAQDVATALFAERLIPVCAKDFEAICRRNRLLSLENARLIVHRDRPHAWYEWSQLAEMEAPKASQIIELDSMFSVARAAEQGLGIALVPELLTDDWFRSGALVRAFAVSMQTRDCYYVVHRREDMKKPAVRALAEWILQSFGHPREPANTP